MNAAISLITGCAGFLLAVIWMDLIFDVQVLSHRKAGALPEAVLASIANYYHRATTTSRPMSRLIAFNMLVLVGALTFRSIQGHEPGWLIALSTALAGVPILLAVLRTVPNAVRLGNRADSVAEQTGLARSIYRQHLLCAACLAVLLALWIAHDPLSRLL